MAYKEAKKGIRERPIKTNHRHDYRTAFIEWCCWWGEGTVRVLRMMVRDTVILLMVVSPSKTNKRTSKRQKVQEQHSCLQYLLQTYGKEFKLLGLTCDDLGCSVTCNP